MHLLVLSAFRQKGLIQMETKELIEGLNAPSGAQCFPTFAVGLVRRFLTRLNAPSGAQCFPTQQDRKEDRNDRLQDVSMHLLVLSAFRQGYGRVCRQCHTWSQCTFWCSVLSDRIEGRARRVFVVSMHLLVLSAFRLYGAAGLDDHRGASLNAPSGAQCFPTPPPENRATRPFTGTKSPPTWKAPHRIGPHLSN